MVFILLFFISFTSIIIGKCYLGKWINHISIYTTVWFVMIFLYEIKLLPYPNISFLTWFFILCAFLSFLLGNFTILTTRRFSTEQNIPIKNHLSLSAFKDEGKIIKFSIIIFSLITLFAAIQHWMVLFKMFGSLPMILLNATKIYRMNQEGEIKGVIPFISYFGFISIFFAGIYTAYRGKFTFIAFFPFITVILKELAQVGRAGMLFAVLEFFLSFILFRHSLVSKEPNRFKFSKINLFISVSILLLLIILSSTLVKVSRTTTETYSGTSRSLKQFQDNIFFSPSVYLYLSSDLGVLQKYLHSDGETTKFGQNTLLPIYDILAKFGFNERPPDFQKGYFIPMWTNTGTFIRELHADFGIGGVLLVPYFLGLILTWLWFRFYEKQSMILLVLLVFGNLIIGFSFLTMVTRLLYWLLCLFFLIIFFFFLEKYFDSKKGYI